MENFLRSKKYWQVVFEGVAKPAVVTIVTHRQRAELEAQRLKDLKVKRQQLQSLHTKFETLQIKTGESVSEYLTRTMVIVNKMRIHSDKIEDMTVVEKILQTMTPKFNYVVCLEEEAHNINELSADELQGSLLVHEHKLNQQEKEKEEQALKSSVDNNSKPRGDRGRGGSKG
ncbi:uncharacterized protein LOC133034139 [Cannabis sativa]|uniref:uncharacterized protein LOC133034139 n=1 Tax=Cannabis sativa TaxID=3483 RepID=UPI0029CA1714|nr:uncharacterized protein LOC133034139 [Cannabis sativa]